MTFKKLVFALLCFVLVADIFEAGRILGDVPETGKTYFVIKLRNELNTSIRSIGKISCEDLREKIACRADVNITKTFANSEGSVSVGFDNLEVGKPYEITFSEVEIFSESGNWTENITVRQCTG